MWHNNGGKYSIKTGDIRQLDQGGYKYRVNVWVKDNKTGKIEKRIGDGRSMGNFTPIWINWKGKSVQIEQLLNE